MAQCFVTKGYIKDCCVAGTLRDASKCDIIGQASAALQKKHGLPEPSITRATSTILAARQKIAHLRSFHPMEEALEIIIVPSL